MKLKELKTIVNKAYNVDLTNMSRKHEYKIPRFVFCHYARKYLKSPKGTVITFDEIAIFLDLTHASIKNAVTSYDNLMSYYPDYLRVSELIEVKIKKKLGIKIEKKEIKILAKENTELRECEKLILKDLKELSGMDISELHETRIKPYLAMLKTRVTHNVEETKGAVRKFSMN